MRNNFRHLVAMLVFITGFSYYSTAQDFLPALNDNFMGINQALLQPAAIADSRFISDFNIAGFSNDMYNDAVHFRSRWILYPTDILTNEDWWDENTYLANKNGRDDNLFMSQSALGPGFMANLSSKHSIGFTSRVRSILNIDGVGEPLFRLVYSNYQEEEYYNKWYFDKEMRAVQHVFGDYGLTYARIIPLPNKEHFLKAGITVKLLQGIASSYIQTEDLYYYFNGETYPASKDISLNSPNVQGGVSDNWGDLNKYGSYTFSMNYQFTAKPSVGMDLGVVYEFRKDMINDDVDRSERADKNKYFVKVGFSVLDIGRLKYKKDYYSSDYMLAFTPDYQNRYNTNDNSVPENTAWLDAGDVSYSFRDYPDFSYAMHQRSLNGEGVQKATTNSDYFTVRLPAAISLQVDLNLFLDGLYVNYTSYHGLNKGYSHAPNSHYISTYSITPRYEQKWYGVSVPVIINQYGKVDVGLGVRAGFIYAGVNNLFSNAFNDTYGIHAYVGVKVPIHQKDPNKIKKIKDKTVMNDSQNRGGISIIQDSFNNTLSTDDHSINISSGGGGGSQGVSSGGTGGSLSLKDITGSHIPDVGSGSPDSESDGPGVEPDSPGSGSDGNGSGTGSGSSGSGSGSEGSGSGSGGSGSGSGGAGQGEGIDLLPDNSHLPNKTTNSTLPAENYEFKSINFAFGTAKNSQENNAYLDRLAMQLINQPGMVISIEGHTDNVGSEAFNMNLSKIRAEETRKYLLSKGVNADQMTVKWYGESKPLDDKTKDTPEGRNNNRRVEFKIEQKT